MEYSIVKLTSKKVKPLKPKHVQIVTAATFQSDYPLSELFRFLSNRFKENNWIIVMKSLIVVHILIREGSTDRIMGYLANNPSITDVSNFRDKSGNSSAAEQTNNLMAYSLYLSEKIADYQSLNIEFVKSKKDFIDRCRRGACDLDFLHAVEILQRQINALLNSSFEFALINNVVTLQAYRLLIGDLMSLFHVLNEAVIRILSEYFDMNKKLAEKALQIYKNFAIQTGKTVEFFDTARRLKGSLELDIPVFKHAPVSLAGALEDYLKNTDFDDLERRRKEEASPSKANNNSNKNNKNNQIIDFFESIDDSPQKEPQNFDSLFGPGTGSQFNEIQNNLEKQAKDLQLQLERLQEMNNQSYVEQKNFYSSMPNQVQHNAIIPTSTGMAGQYSVGFPSSQPAIAYSAPLQITAGISAASAPPNDFTIENVFGPPSGSTMQTNGSMVPYSGGQQSSQQALPFGSSGIDLYGRPTQIKDPFAALTSNAVVPANKAPNPTVSSFGTSSLTAQVTGTNPFAFGMPSGQFPNQSQQQPQFQPQNSFSSAAVASSVSTFSSPGRSDTLSNPTFGNNYVVQGSQQPFLGAPSGTGNSVTNPFLVGTGQVSQLQQQTLQGSQSASPNSWSPTHPGIQQNNSQKPHIDPFTSLGSPNNSNVNPFAAKPNLQQNNFGLMQSSNPPSLGSQSSYSAFNSVGQTGPQSSSGNGALNPFGSLGVAPSTAALVPTSSFATSNSTDVTVFGSSPAPYGANATSFAPLNRQQGAGIGITPAPNPFLQKKDNQPVNPATSFSSNVTSAGAFTSAPFTSSFSQSFSGANVPFQNQSNNNNAGFGILTTNVTGNNTASNDLFNFGTLPQSTNITQPPMNEHNFFAKNNSMQNSTFSSSFSSQAPFNVQSGLGPNNYGTFNNQPNLQLQSQQQSQPSQLSNQSFNQPGQSSAAQQSLSSVSFF